MAFPIFLGLAAGVGLVALLARRLTSSVDPQSTYTLIAIWGDTNAFGVTGELGGLIISPGTRFRKVPVDVRVESDMNGPYSGSLASVIPRAQMFMNRLSGDPPNVIMILDALSTIRYVITRRVMPGGHTVENRGVPPITLL